MPVARSGREQSSEDAALRSLGSRPRKNAGGPLPGPTHRPAANQSSASSPSARETRRTVVSQEGMPCSSPHAPSHTEHTLETPGREREGTGVATACSSRGNPRAHAAPPPPAPHAPPGPRSKVTAQDGGAGDGRPGAARLAGDRKQVGNAARCGPEPGYRRRVERSWGSPAFQTCP